MGESWKIAADRDVIGDKVELETLPGFWVRPRRYTKQGEAAIRAAEMKPILRKQGVRKRIIAEVDTAPKSDSEAAIGQISDAAKDKIMVAMIDSLDGDELDTVDAQVLAVYHGIAETNFSGDAEPPTKEWAKELTQYADIFNEVLEIVREKNRPLARKPSNESEASPNGSPKEGETPPTASS